MGLFLVVSLFGNCLLFGLLGLTQGESQLSNGADRVVQEILVSGGKDKIAILPAHGTVDGEMVDRIHRYIEAIQADPHIRAVIIEVDSPGGTITASDEIHHMFMQLRDQNYPLTVYMRSLAASGGYYISMPAQKIYAEPTTMTGSIGVIWPAFELSGLLQKVGITPEIITSDQAVFKDSASPFKKFTAEDRAYIKGLVNDAHLKFTKIVAVGRGTKLTVPMNQIAIGRVWSADDALKLGLIDHIGYLDTVYTEVARTYGLGNPTIVRLKDRVGLIEMLGASSMTNKNQIVLDPKMIYQLQTPRMEYRYLDPATAN